MRERIESKHVTKEIKSQMPVIPVEIIKERGCTFCPYYLGSYEKEVSLPEEIIIDTQYYGLVGRFSGYLNA